MERFLIIVLHSSVVIRPSNDCLCFPDSLGIFKLFRNASMKSKASTESFVLYAWVLLKSVLFREYPICRSVVIEPLFNNFRMCFLT